MRTSTRTKNVMAAIRQVQASMPLVEKSETVKIEGGGSSRVEKFAPLDEIWKRLQPLCNSHGLTVVQLPGIGATGGGIITTRIEWTDESSESEFIEGDIPVSPPKPGFRDFGAFYSYARRIALLSSFGIVPCGEDPDHHEVEQQIKNTAPPRANRGARPTNIKDPEAEAERIITDLKALPPGSSKAMVDELAQQMSGIAKEIKADTNDRARKAFSDKRRELGLS
jgi:hypothetical protein